MLKKEARRIIRLAHPDVAGNTSSKGLHTDLSQISLTGSSFVISVADKSELDWSERSQKDSQDNFTRRPEPGFSLAGIIGKVFGKI